MKRILSNVPGNYELRIDLEDWDGETRYAQYSLFDIGGTEDNYKLAVNGYTGNAGDISEKLIPGLYDFSSSTTQVNIRFMLVNNKMIRLETILMFS